MCVCVCLCVSVCVSVSVLFLFVTAEPISPLGEQIGGLEFQFFVPFVFCVLLLCSLGNGERPSGPGAVPGQVPDDPGGGHLGRVLGQQQEDLLPVGLLLQPHPQARVRSEDFNQRRAATCLP